MLRAFETRQVYHPVREHVASPEVLGHAWREFNVRTGDGETVHGWYFPASQEGPLSEMALLLCHGNAGNISHRLGFYDLLHGLGANLIAFDYRGYGKSSGSPDEEGTYHDAQAVYEWARAEGFEPGQIVLLGKSLGGAIAAELALREAVGGLILQNTFTSVPDMAADLFPWLPARWLCRIEYGTARKLPRISVPVLVMHSKADSIVPYYHSQRNFAMANAPKRFVELKGDHNETTHGEGYVEAIQTFVIEIARLNVPERSDEVRDGSGPKI